MENDARIPLPAAAPGSPPLASLWPSAEYDRQLERLRAAVGRPVYLVEVSVSEIQMTVRLGNRPATLLQVLDFPAADPAKRLYPHMIVLDDGRGLNLGWIARISIGQAFEPGPDQIVFQQTRLLQQLLFRERQLSAGRIAETARRQLAALLGRSAPALNTES